MSNPRFLTHVLGSKETSGNWFAMVVKHCIKAAIMNMHAVEFSISGEYFSDRYIRRILCASFMSRKGTFPSRLDAIY